MVLPVQNYPNICPEDTLSNEKESPGKMMMVGYEASLNQQDQPRGQGET